ncbi:rhomboid family intramembrane serine protease [Kribbella solani]|uniref:Membrane associated rhomboid family serine protease n=1 Tax=Kribbella solani TaxID=236067 RepID=A0A841DI82_9ACTN|nr:rhomboid family intramembrane serine protease [Kribbella solani]MBB5978202.1 membrane associated rhomboid family serine protease [Kribbella solani]MDX2968030.1 rhomboid family intramembrane serine protease [Kribbella solani]MDX3005442.1 rhomboid family intramembrane serine protease [Kribbella solani]
MSFQTPAKRTGRAVDTAKVGGGLKLLGVLVGLMWLSEIIDTATHGALDQYGIIAREPRGLIGILTAPFLHLGFGHLISNTLPLVTLGALIAISGAARLFAVTAIVTVIGGFGTWLVSPSNTITIGASGLVFGYASYLILRGLFNRRISQVLIGVLVVVVWGSALLGGLLPQDGISWQGHLFGGIAGVLAAWVLSDDKQQQVTTGRSLS